VLFEERNSELEVYQTLQTMLTFNI
jgi:hypothetical protein